MKNLKKALKKAQALLLLVLSIVMVTPMNVFADLTQPGTATGTTATVKVNGVEQNDNVTVNAYKIIEVLVENNQPKAPVFVWAKGVGEWLKANNYSDLIMQKDGADYTVGTGENLRYVVAEKFCTGKNTCMPAADVKVLYDKLAAAIKDSTNTFTLPVAATTTATGDITLSLEMGNYLVLINNGVAVYEPSAINIVPTYDEEAGWTVADTTIEVKSTSPSIDKKVEGADESTVNVGDTLTYTITVDIPNYPSNALAKNVTVKDTFSTGLTFNGITKIELITEGEDNEELTKTTLGNALVEGGQVNGFTLTFTKDNYNLIEGRDQLVITYTGTVNENAVVGANGNDNTAELSYNRDPYDTTSFEPTTDIVKVYTFGAKIKKVKASDKTILPGAEFTISTDNNGSVGTAISFVEVTANGTTKYRKAKEGETGDTKLVVPADGIIVVEGLDEGSYWLTETKAPGDYVKLENPIPFTITAETTTDNSGNTVLTGNVNDDATAVNPTTDGYYEMQVENSNDIIVLPTTGGIGTLLFSVIGILFMGLGAFLIKNILRKEDVQ